MSGRTRLLGFFSRLIGRRREIKNEIKNLIAEYNDQIEIENEKSVNKTVDSLMEIVNRCKENPELMEVMFKTVVTGLVTQVKQQHKYN